MVHQGRERRARPIKVPTCMAPLLQDQKWARNTVGESGAALYRLYRIESETELYLKYGRGPIADDVTDEMVRLRWLARYIPVPKIRHFVASSDEAWLLMTAMPGRTAYQILADDPDDGPAVVDALARFLRRLHALPVEQCPFNSDHRLRLAHARNRLDAGLIDVEDFDEEREGWTAEQVWDEMMELLPFVPDQVVTHGDFSLDNILMEGDEVIGCIDAGRVGIADRYQDLAILWNCLGEFHSTLQHQLFATYGINQPDERKLRFHLALDECF